MPAGGFSLDSVFGVGSNPVASIFLRKKPFDENVERRSHCGDKSCAVERAVQTHDFEDSTLCIVVGGKPLLAKRLRKFKQIGRAHV